MSVNDGDDNKKLTTKMLSTITCKSVDAHVTNMMDKLAKENVMNRVLKSLKRLNAGNDYMIPNYFHPDFKSIHMWIPFDEDDDNDGHKGRKEKELMNEFIRIPDNTYGSRMIKAFKRYALVCCDSDNKDLFGQVATVVCANEDIGEDRDKHHDESFIDNMVGMNIEQYCKEKYSLHYSLNDLIVQTLDNIYDKISSRFLTNIVIEYAADIHNLDNHFIKDLRQSMNFIL
jgi:hypothetical protein